jgi:hypothetical protein
VRYAIVQNGTIANIVEATPEVANDLGLVECPTHHQDGEPINVGDTYQNNTFGKNQNINVFKWSLVRQHRDGLLIKSDIAVLPDRWNAMTEEQKTAWQNYRQALRDIPQTFSLPDEVVWPSKPSQ